MQNFCRRENVSQPLPGKINADIFFYYQGVLFLNFRGPSINIKAEQYADILQ